ncbi:hypothetical protein [Variovorax sp. E3]|jgi:hypothetical protein|uniref:hypothetical protein n=1 Tax=Variovorax sp. E3 TaxID=1914993 RepID=UPI0018DBFB08|nr:hypothetical protein [Variovorax sp. E3]
MQSFVDRALQLLQQMAYARVMCEFHRLQDVRCRASDVCSNGFVRAQERMAKCEQRFVAYQATLGDPEKVAAVRVARALYLRLLLQSATARLQPWSDVADIMQMPPSHMFEWIAHDFERLELAALEDAMTPAEIVLYTRSIEGVHG